MRPGTILSLLGHGTLVLLGLLSMPNSDRFEAAEPEALPIEIIDESELTQITQGDLNTKELKDNPAQVDSPLPTAPDKPAGTVAEQQENRGETDKASDFTAIQKAIETLQEEERKKKAEDEAKLADLKKKEAEKQEAEKKAAEEKAEAEDKKKQAEIALKKKQEEEKKKKLEEEKKKKEEEKRKKEEAEKKKKEEEKKKAEEEKKKKLALEKKKKEEEAKKAAQAQKEKSKGGTTGQGGEKSAGSEDGKGPKLSASAIAKLQGKVKACFNPPLSAEGDTSLKVTILFKLKENGALDGNPKVLTSLSDSLHKSVARAAVRSIKRCGPYEGLPKESYWDWKEVEVDFTP